MSNYCLIISYFTIIILLYALFSSSVIFVIKILALTSLLTILFNLLIFYVLSILSFIQPAANSCKHSIIYNLNLYIIFWKTCFIFAIAHDYIYYNQSVVSNINFSASFSRLSICDSVSHVISRSCIFKVEHLTLHSYFRYHLLYQQWLSVNSFHCRAWEQSVLSFAHVLLSAFNTSYQLLCFLKYILLMRVISLAWRHCIY